MEQTTRLPDDIAWTFACAEMDKREREARIAKERANANRKYR